MGEYIICGNCPCLNDDREDDSTCNLGYDCDLYWFDKKTMERVEDTPEMRSHQKDFILFYASTNCRLVEIKTEDGSIYPETQQEILENINSKNDNIK